MAGKVPNSLLTTKGISIHDLKTGHKLSLCVDGDIQKDINIIIPTDISEDRDPILVTEENVDKIVVASNTKYMDQNVIPNVNKAIDKKFADDIAPTIRTQMDDFTNTLEEKLRDTDKLNKETREMIDDKNREAKREIEESLEIRLQTYDQTMQQNITSFREESAQANVKLKENFDLMSKELESNTKKSVEAIENFKEEVEEKLGIVRKDLQPEEVVSFVESVSSLTNEDEWRVRGSNNVYSKNPARDTGDEPNILYNILQKDYNDLRDAKGRKLNIEEKIQILANDLKAVASSASRSVPTGTIIGVIAKRYKDQIQIYYDNEIKQNYLPCNGASINVDVYPELAIALGYKGIIKKQLNYSAFYIKQELKFISSLIQAFGRAKVDADTNGTNLFEANRKLGIDVFSTWFNLNQGIIVTRDEYRSPSTFSEIEDEFKKEEYVKIRSEFAENGFLSNLQYQPPSTRVIYIDTSRPDNDNIVSNTSNIEQRTINLPNLHNRYLKFTNTTADNGNLNSAKMPRIGGDVWGLSGWSSSTANVTGDFKLEASSASSQKFSSSGSGSFYYKVKFRPYETNTNFSRIMDANATTIDTDHILLLPFIKI